MTDRDREIAELLPWYAAGTLSPQESAAVEDFLERHPERRREVEEMRALGETEIALSEQTPALDPALFQRALDEIEAYESSRAPVAAEPGAPEPGAAQRILRTLTGWWTPAPTFARAVMAAQFALLLGLASLYLADRGDSPATTLGGPEVPGEGVRIAVQFHETATEAQIRELLGEVEASITAGPSALGLYTLTVAGDAEEAVRVLRARSEVVAFAEASP